MHYYTNPLLRWWQDVNRRLEAAGEPAALRSEVLHLFPVESSVEAAARAVVTERQSRKESAA